MDGSLTVTLSRADRFRRASSPCPCSSPLAQCRWMSTCVFFFSSRRRHTRFDCDWSSDVCSSDLNGLMGVAFGETRSNGGSSFGGDRGRDRQAQAQLYAGWSQGRGYALAQFGSGQFTRALDRQLLLGAGVYGVSARYGGGFCSARVGGGDRLGRGGGALWALPRG